MQDNQKPQDPDYEALCQLLKSTRQVLTLAKRNEIRQAIGLQPIQPTD